MKLRKPGIFPNYLTANLASSTSSNYLNKYLSDLSFCKTFDSRHFLNAPTISKLWCRELKEAMAKLVSRIVGWFRSNTMVGIDKSGNRYFTRTEDLDGFLKERRSVKFKSDSDPTTLPVEWISWLTGRRKEAPTPQEMLELEAQRERVKMNAAILQKEEEKRRFRAKSLKQSMDSGDVGPPNLASFIQDFSDASNAHGEGGDVEKISQETHENADRVSEPTGTGSSFRPGTWQPPESSEPTGTGQSFQPGTWQPPK